MRRVPSAPPNLLPSKLRQLRNATDHPRLAKSNVFPHGRATPRALHSAHSDPCYFANSNRSRQSLHNRHVRPAEKLIILTYCVYRRLGQQDERSQIPQLVEDPVKAEGIEQIEPRYRRAKGSQAGMREKEAS